MRVTLLTVPLTERSQGGTIGACFVVKGDRVVGAYLELDGYRPNIGSLTDRDLFLPAGLNPEHLTFDDVADIEIIGPWDGNEWARRVTYRDAGDIGRVTRMLSASAAEQGRRGGTWRDEEYMLVLHYADGPEIRVRVVTDHDTGETYATYDTEPLWEWYYLPPAELKAEVKSALGAS